MQTTGPITIPEGFFPPPGVPFETEAQKYVGVALHNAGVISIETTAVDGWIKENKYSGICSPSDYRLATPKPRTVGPFESVHVGGGGANDNAWSQAINAAKLAGITNHRIKLTATAEEIL